MPTSVDIISLPYAVIMSLPYIIFFMLCLLAMSYCLGQIYQEMKWNMVDDECSFEAEALYQLQQDLKKEQQNRENNQLIPDSLTLLRIQKENTFKERFNLTNEDFFNFQQEIACIEEQDRLSYIEEMEKECRTKDL